ncbi:B12-binding domain-containing protein, partial [Streptomyces sp. JJ36]|uniref:cobalamin B12-binding domain-containing protein n=1 Tax=Streptomyces sp. JJ36 TaxID=2736645 RepID=UPI001F165FF3
GRAPAAGAAAGALPLGAVRRECRGLARAAVRLDAPAVDDAIAAALAEYGLIEAWNEVMMPALRAVGRKWATEGERYVEVEHLLSWHVSAGLRRLAAQARPGSAQEPPVLLACVPGELHSLPLEALAAGLGERGLPLRMFGAAVPVQALDDAVQRTGPSAVVLWSQSRGTASRPLARHLCGIAWGVQGARHGPAVLLGGPGWSGTAVEGALRPHGLREALDLLSALFRPSPASSPPATRRA